MEVGRIILEQLGGNKFRTMTGANSFVAGKNDLSFKLPGGRGFTKDGINYVRITLTPDDTYTMTFSRIRKFEIKPIKEFTDVYAEDLQTRFRETTGLDTHL